MKKLLLILTLVFAVVFAYAQQVELRGTGMFQHPIESIPSIDETNLVDVTLFAVFLHSYGISPANQIILSDNSESYNVPFTEIPAPLNYGPLPESGLGYFTKVFDGTVDADGEKINAAAIDNIHLYSFYGFIKRDDPDADYYSVYDYTHVHCWNNGPSDTYTYELDLLDNGLVRNVQITMPFSGLQNNLSNPNREAVVEISAAGMSTITYNFVGNICDDNYNKYFHIFTSDEFEVPATTNKIYVKVYSPTVLRDGKPLGDSFMCGGVVADVSDVPNCTYTQGYWKTHSEYGPAGPADPTWDLLLPDGPNTDFYLSTSSWYEVFWTSPKGNKYYSLAHQFMAAHLNFLNGADPTEAQSAYDAAALLFETYSPADVGADKKLNKEFGSYIGTLTDYNEGTIGPGHCDDGDEEEDPKSSLINAGSEEILVYPNPMSTNGTIDFTAANDGLTTIEVYNMMGARVATLFDQTVLADQKYQVRFNVSEYNGGLYVIYIRNGSNIQKSKLTVVN